MVQGLFVLNFLKRAKATRAFGTMGAAAMVACVLVTWQIAPNERTSRTAAAREIHREFLNISIQRPHLAGQALCAFRNPIERAADTRLVDDMLSTAKQVIAQTHITNHFLPYQTYLCTFEDADHNDLTPVVALVVAGLWSTCEKVPTCEGEENDQS